MRRFTSAKVIILFATATLVVIAAYFIANRSIDKLVDTVIESTKPNLVLLKIKEINDDVTNAENGVRIYALTQNPKYLESYQNLVHTINHKIDTLLILTKDKKYNTSGIDSISVLMKKKLDLYESLLGVNYAKFLQNAIGNIASQFPGDDSTLVDSLSKSGKKGIFKKIFGPSKKELRQKIDSVSNENERNKEKFTNLQRAILGVGNIEKLKLSSQADKEIAMLSKDKQITWKIQTLIRKVETDESYNMLQKAEEAKHMAEKTGTMIQSLIFGGSLFLLVLVGLILYDITKSNSYRKQLAEAKLVAENLGKNKEEFLAKMSHEIRTPLSSVIGYTERLLSTQLDAKQIGYTNAINNSSEHLLSIVNDILDFTKIESGNIGFEKINFNPEKTVNEVYDALKLKAEEKRLSLVFYTNGISDLILNGDPLRLKQVLFNLVDNAIKFTDNGKVEVKCLASQPALKNGLETADLTFIVKDNGIGIPEEKTKTIFTQFSQADTSISRKFGGSGLGLSISKKIIELQGGTISVESKLSEGSSFTVHIPYVVVSTTMQGSNTLTNEKSISPDTLKKLKGLKILLAEDVEINRALQREMMKDFEIDVEEASNGKEVLNKIMNKKFDLLLMDIQMPGMSGIETIKEIRNNIKSSLPAIAITANVMKQDLDRYMEAGFSDYLTKPFKQAELATKLIKILEGNNSAFEKSRNEDPLTLTNELYNLDELKQLSGSDPKFSIKMLELFISNFDETFQLIKTANETNDLQTAGSSAHKLLPSCRQLSANSLVIKLKTLEILCNSKSEKKEIDTVLTEIDQHYIKVKVLLEKELTVLKTEVA